MYITLCYWALNGAVRVVCRKQSVELTVYYVAYGPIRYYHLIIIIALIYGQVVIRR